MATKTARTKRTKAKAEGTPDLTPDQEWAQTQKERAEAARDASIKEQERQMKMTPAELAIDNAKKARDAEAESLRWNALSQSEQNAELDDENSPHYEPLPSWQTRLSSGKVFDARQNAQAFAYLINTDGTTPAGGDRSEALAFLLDYATSAEPDKDKDEK